MTEYKIKFVRIVECIIVANSPELAKEIFIRDTGLREWDILETQEIDKNDD